MKFKSVLCILIVFLMISCSKDNDGGSIMGRWTLEKTIIEFNGDKTEIPYQGNQPGCEKNYQIFVEDGSRYNASFAADCTLNGVSSTWSASGDNLILTGPTGGTYKLEKVSNNVLRYYNYVEASGGFYSKRTYVYRSY